MDFPFYNDNPRISWFGWLVLFISLFVSLLVYLLFYDFSEFTAAAFQCLTIIIPLLYYCNWDYNLIFHQPNRDEIILAFTMFICYIVYSIMMAYLLEYAGLLSSDSVPVSSESMVSFLSLVFYMMTEELIKFIPLMFFMRFFYKFSGKRNLSFTLSSAIVLVGFGLLHYGNGLTVFSVLLIQGLGTIFELYGYYKTKNLFVSYLSHLFTDAFIMGLVFLPF